MTGRASTIAFPRRFSISFLMAVVCLVAADFAVFGYVEEFEGPRNCVIITLPMINLMILSLPRVRGNHRRYWVGFLSVGSLMTCVFGYLAWTGPDWFSWPLTFTQQALPRLEEEVNKLGDLAASSFFLTFITVVYTAPLVMVSMLGGRISASSARRRRSPEPAS